MVRWLPPSDYGDITLGVSTISLVSPLAGLGIPYGIARQLAHSKDDIERHHLKVSALKIVIPMAILAGLAVYLAAPVLSSSLGNPQMTFVLELFSVYLAASMISSTIGAFFQGQENMYPLTLFNYVVTPLLLLGMLLLFFTGGASLTLALVAYVLSTTGGMVGLALYAFRDRWRPTPEQRMALAQESAPNRTLVTLFLFSLPLTLLGVASVVTGNVDTLVLGYYTHDTALVGTYSAVVTVTRLLTLGVGSFSAIVLPVSSRLHSTGSEADLRKSYATMTKWLLLLFMPIFVIFMVFPSPTLLFIYGPVTQTTPYADAPWVLMIGAAGAILTVLVGPAQSVLTGLGKLRLLVYDTVAAATIDIVGSLALVPFMGVYGAVIAFAAATAALPMLAVFQTGAANGIHPFSKPVLRPLFAFCIVAFAGLSLPVFLLHWDPKWYILIVLYFALLCLYALIVLATRSTEAEDLYLLGVVENILGTKLPEIRRIVLKFEDKYEKGKAESPPAPPLR